MKVKLSRYSSFDTVTRKPPKSMHTTWTALRPEQKSESRPRSSDSKEVTLTTYDKALCAHAKAAILEEHLDYIQTYEKLSDPHPISGAMVRAKDMRRMVGGIAESQEDPVAHSGSE
jgi:hypothetical protein